MEWWAALIVAGVPALITAVSLIVQQRANTSAAERADERRSSDAEAERKHQERMLEVSNEHAHEQAEQDHRRQAREAWKTDRRASHTRLLTRLEEIADAAGTLLARVSVDYSLGQDPRERDFDLPELPQEFIADVALVGSDTSASKAQQAGVAASILKASVAMIDILWQDRTNDERRSDLAKAQESQKALNKAITAYRQAAKRDMDTVE